MLPCNVAVWEDDAGKVMVAAVDPRAGRVQPLRSRCRPSRPRTRSSSPSPSGSASGSPGSSRSSADAMGEWDFLAFLAFVVGWIFLQRVVLPRAGVPT